MSDYSELRAAFAGYLAGSLSPDELKTRAAPLGVYQQRDGRFMVRVRVNGGQIDVASLAGFADVLARVGGVAHLTSRQDLQLHDVPAERVLDAVEASHGLGWPFKGGGGNTYRNTVVGPYSGLSAETVFDVYPYAEALNLALLGFQKAYELPRKFKVGLFACEGDVLKAAVHDLGFVARLRDGRPGFGVFAGGGLGRESAVGLCLADFLPAERLVQAAFAALSLFYDHGDRTNRHQARLRFVLGRLGPEAFARLFQEYYAAAEAPLLDPSKLSPVAGLPAGACAPGALEGVRVPRGRAEDFSRWAALAATRTRLGSEIVSVRLFVPYGDLLAGQLRAVARLAADAGCACVRLLPTQDVLIPYVRAAALPGLYARLCDELSDIDLTFRSYKGHIVTCVGASVCKIGMADAPAVSDLLAEALDGYLPADTPARLALQRLVADEFRISGCPNACAGHPAALLGIGCVSRRVEGDVVPFGTLFSGAASQGGTLHLSAPAPGGPQPIAEVVEGARRALLSLAGVDG